MMRRIGPQDHHVAGAVFEGLSSIHVALVSVLNGTLKGEVWVDDPSSPRVGLAKTSEGFFLAGNPSGGTDLFQQIRSIIPDWAYLYLEDRWVSHLPKVWHNQFALPHLRIRMTSETGMAPPMQLTLPRPFELEPIDRRIFEGSTNGLDVLDEGIGGWASRDKFFDLAIGFCVLHEGQIVSHCVTDSVSGDRCEIGVRTATDFRHLGLGRIVASATLAECIRRGVSRVEWHTHASNKGSFAIARTIGLTKAYAYTARSCSLPAENVGDLCRAECLALAKHFERAGSQIDWCWFHAAAARALAGDRPEAVENVRRLLASNWEGDARSIERHWALKTLADRPPLK